MYEPPAGREVVLRTRPHQECLESHLVLTAAGIAAEAIHRNGWWFLVVDRADFEKSVAELDDFRRENSQHAVSSTPNRMSYDGSAAGVVFFAVIVVLASVLATLNSFDRDWFSAGRMQSGRVVDGELWRTVTALTLHLDTAHLLANLTFGGLFGLLAGQSFGGGVAWLMIVLAGSLGNWINAILQGPTHASIGASTAVFAALGIVVAREFGSRGGAAPNRWRRWSPLIGGVVLLAFTGMGGERTDVIAHLTGFASGFCAGWFARLLPHQWLASRTVQQGAGVVAVGVIVAAWFAALTLSK